MSIKTFFASVEDGAVKVVSFVVKEMTAAETLLGAGTGSAKANIVITAVESALSAMGVPIGTVQSELKAVVDAITALMNKAGIFSKGTTPPAA
jgi:6-phosphogluconolactonase/glucosamine-6-phosphate isomerase/deaminase